jgi:hypothetical protein
VLGALPEQEIQGGEWKITADRFGKWVGIW